MAGYPSDIGGQRTEDETRNFIEVESIDGDRRLRTDKSVGIGADRRP